MNTNLTVYMQNPNYAKKKQKQMIKRNRGKKYT